MLRFENFLSLPRAAYVLLAVSLGAVGFALISQHVFGFDPCVLCLWQRVPYWMTALCALLLIFTKPRSAQITLLTVIVLCFVAGVGLAAFHTGVELHWWLGTEGCAITPLNGTAPEDLRTKLLGTPAAHCDQISWTFIGLSMANWNVAASLVLLVYTVLVIRKTRT